MNPKYKVAAIGTAWASQSPLPALSTHPLVELVAICSARMERAQEAAAKFGVQHAFDNYEKMLHEAECDIVYVGGPVALHQPMALAAAAAGKHLLCEKPLAINAHEGAVMLDAVRSRNLAHLVAFTMRNYPGPHYVRRLLDENAIGEIRHINMSFWFSLPPQVPRVYGWLNDLSRGGGMLNAMGSHYLDLARWFAGDFATVSGVTRTWRKELPDEKGEMHTVTADDSFALTATMKNDAVVTIHMSSEALPGSGSRIELYGTEGAIVLDGLDQLRVTRNGAREPETVSIPPVAFSESAAACQSPRFGELITEMIRWIESGHEASPNFADALAVQRVIDAIRQSNDESRTIRLPDAN